MDNCPLVDKILCSVGAEPELSANCCWISCSGSTLMAAGMAIS